MSRVVLALILLLVSVADASDSRVTSSDEAVQRAVRLVNEQYQGRVLSAKVVEGGQGGWRVRVKFLSNDGVVRVLVVNPAGD